MVAVDTSIAKVLPGLTQSLQSALSGLPNQDSLVPPTDGITLLDAKNEIFLSYLQTLALRNLAVIRSVGKHIKHKSSSANGDAKGVLDQSLDDQLVRDLVKHRVYLEKGVRPLEDRLKYQVDKVVRAADDEARAAQKAASASSSTTKKSSKTAQAAATGSDDSDSDSDPDSDEETGQAPIQANARSFMHVFTSPGAATSAAPATNARQQAMQEDGIYRPPRITATAMPTTEHKEAKEKRPMRSATIDEYVANELSTAPAAEPSIGSTIAAGGRRDKSARERKEEEERRVYEESNLVRLPKESKKDKAKKAHKERGAYGGEDWRGLTDGVDRIDRLTKKKIGSGGALERSRKRKADEDGQRGDGAGGVDMGRDFERRKKRTMRK